MGFRRKMLILLLAGLISPLLPAAPVMDQPIEADTPGALHTELETLRKKAPKKQMAEFEQYVSELRQDLIDDPFVPRDEVDARLVRQLTGKSPNELLTDDTNTAGLDEPSEYWSLREQVYAERLGELSKDQKRALETSDLLEDVYVYNYRFELEGKTTIDKAYLVFQLRNGTQESIDSVRLRVFIHLPKGSEKEVLKANRYVRIPKPVSPWETRTVKHDITSLIPEAIRHGHIQKRKDLAVEMRLTNFHTKSQDWAVTYFPSYRMRELERTEEGLKEARLALGKSQETSGDSADSMMMMAE